jgi:hypothetical protein
MEEDSPVHLRSVAYDALSWFNRENSSYFELTGLVGADKFDDIEKPFEIYLVHFNGEICACEQVLFTPDADASFLSS